MRRSMTDSTDDRATRVVANFASSGIDCSNLRVGCPCVARNSNYFTPVYSRKGTKTLISEVVNGSTFARQIKIKRRQGHFLKEFADYRTPRMWKSGMVAGAIVSCPPVRTDTRTARTRT
jgi:hypothetical protein